MNDGGGLDTARVLPGGTSPFANARPQDIVVSSLTSFGYLQRLSSLMWTRLNQRDETRHVQPERTGCGCGGGHRNRG